MFTLKIYYSPGVLKKSESTLKGSPTENLNIRISLYSAIFLTSKLEDMNQQHTKSLGSSLHSLWLFFYSMCFFFF